MLTKVFFTKKLFMLFLVIGMITTFYMNIYSVLAIDNPIGPIKYSDEYKNKLYKEDSIPTVTEFTIKESDSFYNWAFDLGDIPEWQVLEQGLWLGKFQGITKAGENFEIVMLKINPQYYDFSLHMASQTGKAFSLQDWSNKYKLNAVINASMYLPDRFTSTGYLRSHDHINNIHIGKRLGAFFVAAPYNSDLPSANLLDRTINNWEILLPQYKIVAQNYRLISANRQCLWSKKKLIHSIAAVACDGKGYLFFIHTRYPISEIDFCNLLLSLPIDIRTVMYVEGGSQAGLLIATSNFKQVWMGKHPVNMLSIDNTSTPIPNVIGIKKKKILSHP